MRGVAQTCFLGLRFSSKGAMQKAKVKPTERASHKAFLFLPFAFCILRFALFFPKSRRPKKQVCATT